MFGFVGQVVAKRSPFDSTSSDDSNQILKEKLKSQLQIFDSLHQRERDMLNEARSLLEDTPYRSLSHLTKEISSLLEQRTTSLKDLKELTQWNPTVPKFVNPVRNPTLSFIQEPREISYGDRLVLPSPVIQVVNHESHSDLQVRVSLWFSTSEKEATIGDSSDIALQGNMVLPLDKDGTATFHNLKVADVGAKSRRQSYYLLFSLENTSKVLTSMKSQSFVAHTRPANILKRKRDSNDEEQLWSKKPSEEVIVTPKVKAPSQPEYNYVDITELLTLPQKEAAQRLHISESMLCKRFKECTRRKWPYRYLCKIDKVINLLYNQSEGQLSDEDKEKLERLVQEREECLQPVKIRIIPHERDTTMEEVHTQSQTLSPDRSPQMSPASSPKETSAYNLRNSPPRVAEKQAMRFSDEEQFAMHTLELLKTQVKK